MRKQSHLYIFIFFVGFLLGIIILFKLSLDTIQKIFSILSSCSIFIALLAYTNQKRREENTSAMEQVSLFRKEIIPKMEELNKLIFKYFPTYKHKKIDLKADFKKTDEYNERGRLYSEISIRNKQIDLLNLMEEFSIKIIHLGIMMHPALIPVRNLFKKVVEENIYILVKLEENESSYPSIFLIYKEWV